MFRNRAARPVRWPANLSAAHGASAPVKALGRPQIGHTSPEASLQRPGRPLPFSLNLDLVTHAHSSFWIEQNSGVLHKLTAYDL